ncbi:leucine-rich repeat neuronal 4 [Pelobates cultripes]|uniref:Leucine-rich repeat neuronal 4 n=1 Tax=Pelobates cultripes TaxID=61616 RepID=A0AAD1RK37_PELCU|nr:leucine-rich repeat neuronal 4 [Pelobates cultripes]
MRPGPEYDSEPNAARASTRFARVTGLSQDTIKKDAIKTGHFAKAEHIDQGGNIIDIPLGGIISPHPPLQPKASKGRGLLSNKSLLLDVVGLYHGLPGKKITNQAQADLSRASCLIEYKSPHLLHIAAHGIPVFVGTESPHLSATKCLSLMFRGSETPCQELCVKPCDLLTLTKKGLDWFPACVPGEVKHLDLSFNNLTLIKDEDISHLSELQSLDLKHNQIRDIQWGGNVLSNLKSLDLSNNLLSVVPKCIMLKKVTWLSLAQNPIKEIQPYAFQCFPNLEYLNLSFTRLGSNTSEGISQSGFALNVTQAQESSLRFLDTLDLSGTFLTGVNQDWNRDLPNLRNLSIRAMKELKSLDGLVDAFPHIVQLDCANSSSLSSINTTMFERATDLHYINLQKMCAEQSLNHWHTGIKYIFLSDRLSGLPCVPRWNAEYGTRKGTSFPRFFEELCYSVYRLYGKSQHAVMGQEYMSLLICQNTQRPPTMINQLNRLCNLTSISPWNISSRKMNLTLHDNPLTCNCEFSLWLSKHPEVKLLRINETSCQRDSVSFSLYSDLMLCQLNSINDTYNLTEENENIPTLSHPHVVTSTGRNEYVGTSNDSLKLTSTSQDKASKLSVIKSIIVFKTTSTDSSLTAALPKLLLFSPDNQETTIGPNLKQVSTEHHAYSTNGVLGSTTREQIEQRSVTSPNLLTVTSAIQVEQTTQQTTDIITQKSIKIHGVKGNNPRESSPFVEIPMDYDYHGAEDKPKTTIMNQVVSCDYDPCRHLQTPCFDLQQDMHCLCPGLSGENIVPEPPRLREVTEITDTSAQIHWCAPNSVVHKYQLVYYMAGYEDQSVVDNIYETARQYTLYNLLPDTMYRICAVSVNKAGVSNTENDNLSKSPCTEFKTKPSYIIIMATLSALCGLFLVAITVMSVCLYKMRKNNLLNQYDTHLVSYKNPAFDYQLTIPSYN